MKLNNELNNKFEFRSKYILEIISSGTERE